MRWVSFLSRDLEESFEGKTDTEQMRMRLDGGFRRWDRAESAYEVCLQGRRKNSPAPGQIATGHERAPQSPCQVKGMGFKHCYSIPFGQANQIIILIAVEPGQNLIQKSTFGSRRMRRCCPGVRCVAIPLKLLAAVENKATLAPGSPPLLGTAIRVAHVQYALKMVTT